MGQSGCKHTTTKQIEQAVSVVVCLDEFHVCVAKAARESRTRRPRGILHGAVLIRGRALELRRSCAAFIAVGVLDSARQVCELPNERNAIRTVAGGAGTFYRLPGL